MFYRFFVRFVRFPIWLPSRSRNSTQHNTSKSARKEDIRKQWWLSCQWERMQHTHSVLPSVLLFKPKQRLCISQQWLGKWGRTWTVHWVNSPTAFRKPMDSLSRPCRDQRGWQRKQRLCHPILSPYNVTPLCHPVSAETTFRSPRRIFIFINYIYGIKVSKNKFI